MQQERGFGIITVRRMVYAFCNGLIDSLKFSDIFILDSKSNREQSIQNYRNAKVIDNNIDNFAKRRALQRRKNESNQHREDSSEPKILERTLKCCVLNGCVFWFSIILFENVLLPFIKGLIYMCLGMSSGDWLWTSVFPVLSVTFATLWVLPFYLLSKFVNAIWFADIADTAFRQSGPDSRPRTMNTISIAIADTLFTVFVETIFLVQAKVCLTFVPVLGSFINFFHMCLLHALYCFEYKWFNQGLELHKRLSFIEINWPYFLGFGLPLAVITSWPSSLVVSGCVFSIFFPLFIVSGNQAQVVTCDKQIEFRIFHPTVVISNAILTKTLDNSQNRQVSKTR